MSDEPQGPTEGEATPVFPDGSRPRFDETVKLDMAIANGELALPSHFGRYQVLKRIGIGGFASVYAAFDPELESEVAVKVLAENHSANTAVRQRFVAEARVARRLGNERLIGVFDLGETDDGRPYVVMELAPRGTLRQRIVRTGRPSRDDLIRLINELGACLTAIHAKDVVHRDIKPSNLLYRTEEDRDFVPTRLFEDDERLVLADFGLARDISGGASALTVGGGTEGYMAPEQATTDGKPDVRADIFSATVVVAEMTTGRHPERLDLATANISTDMLEALSRSMSIDRESRPSDAEAWRRLLVDAYAGDVGASPPIGVDHDAATAHLDTLVGGPDLPPTDIQTDIPHTGIEPVSFTPARAGADPPPPPPGLVADDAPAPPAPAPVERPNAIIAAARAQAEAEQREAAEKAARRAERRQARARGRGRGNPAPAGPPAGPVGPPGPVSPPVAEPDRVGPSPAVQTAGAPVTPTPGAPAAAAPAAPGPAPPEPQPPHQTLPTAPADVGTGRSVPAPPSVPVRPSGPQGVGPPSAPPATSPARQPAAAGVTTPAPPGPLPVGGPPPAGGNAAIPVFQPVSPGGPAAPAAPAVVGPAEPGADSGEISRRRSREHMRTASKLAKLERKQQRKMARRARRRRRRRKFVNFFLAIVRGVLAGGLT
ncbi:MAG: serine/threonine-protein kinase, partial [Actinomycetota bacterium]